MRFARSPMALTVSVDAGLFNALLEALHVTDEFDRLVGPTARVPASHTRG